MVDSLIQNTNGVSASPFVFSPITDQGALEDSEWSYQVSADSCGDVDGDVLTYSATLPSWLTFAAQTQTFLCTATFNSLGSRNVLVTSAPSEPPTKNGVLHAVQIEKS